MEKNMKVLKTDAHLNLVYRGIIESWLKLNPMPEFDDVTMEEKIDGVIELIQFGYLQMLTSEDGETIWIEVIK
jgi:hypothetical protein